MANKKLIRCFLIIGLSISRPVMSQEAQPFKGLGNYELRTNDATSIKIPFTMHNGKPLMQVEINGEKGTMMIDNGVLWDQVWLFGSPIVTKLELKPLGEMDIGGSGEGDPTAAFISENLTIKFPNIIFYEQPVLVSPPAAGFARMFPGADGQLSSTFFKHFIVEFDFINNQVILHKPDQFKYKGSGSILDMKINQSGSYSVPFTFETLDGTIYKDRVDIDFGGVYALKVALNNKHNIQLPSNVSQISSYGAQGRSPEYRGKIKSMTIGKYTFENPVVVFGDEKTSRMHPDNLGILGLPLFRKFNIIFDYFNNKIYIDPNNNFNKPIK